MSVIKSLEILLKADNKMLRSDLNKSLRDIQSFSSKVNRSTGGIFSSALAKQGILLNGNDKLLKHALILDKAYQKVSFAIKRMLQIGVAGAFAASAGLMVQSIKQAIETEKYTVKIAMLARGGAKLGIELRDQLREIAFESPFAEEQLFDSATRLMGAGIAVKDIIPLVRSLGDAAAASGTQLNQLALVFSQVFAKNVLQGEEMLQFMERNITLNQELQKIMGVSTEAERARLKGLGVLNREVRTGAEAIRQLQSDGVIGPGEVAKAFMALTKEGGRFEDAMKKLSKTSQGQLVVLQNRWKALKSTIGNELLPVLNDLIEKFSNILKDGKLNETIKVIVTGTKAIVMAFGAMVDAVTFIASSFGGLGLVMGGFAAATLLASTAMVTLARSVMSVYAALKLVENGTLIGRAGKIVTWVGSIAIGVVAAMGLSKAFKESGDEAERISRILGDVKNNMDEAKSLLEGTFGMKLDGSSSGGGGMAPGTKLNVAPAIFGTADAGRAFEVRSKQTSHLENIDNQTKATADALKPKPASLPAEVEARVSAPISSQFRDGSIGLRTGDSLPIANPGTAAGNIWNFFNTVRQGG